MRTLSLLLVLASAASAQSTYPGTINGIPAQSILSIPSITANTLPAASSNNNQTYWIQDGASGTDCTVGGGSNLVACKSNGSGWIGQTLGSNATSGFVSAPLTSTSQCSPGQFSADLNYMYSCVATNTWVATTLSTFPAAPAITSISATSVSNTSETVAWATDQNSSTTVNYGTTSAYGSTSSGSASVTSHSVTLSGLTCATTYHYQVASVSAANSRTSTSSDVTFTTSACGGATPTISSVVATPNQTSASITWTTSITATTSFQYGTTTSYGSTATDSGSGTTSHTVSLTGLTCATAYHYKITATSSGQSSSTSDATLTTTSCGGGSGPTSDDFSGSSLSNNWTMVTPDSSAASVSSGVVSITAAAGASHDPNSGTNVGPYLSESVTGDWTVVTKFMTLPQNNGSTYPGVGYVLHADATHYAQFLAGTDGTTNTALWTAGTSSSTNAGTVNYAVPLYLKLQKSGTSYTFSTSNDGSTYVQSGTLVDTQSVTTLGLSVSNYNGTPASATDETAQVDYSYNTASPGTGAMPYITNFVLAAPTASAVSASFTTDLNATATFQYGTTTSYGSTATDSGSGTQSHAFSVTGLTAGTTYHYRYTATYGSQTYTSTDATFSTTGGNGGPASDDFSGSSLSNTWTLVTPDASSDTVSGGAVSITAVAGANHDPNSGTNAGPRITQPVGTGNWTVIAKFTALPASGGTGFTLSQDSANYAQFLVSGNNYTNVALWTAGTASGVTQATFSYSVPLWIKLSKSGTTYTMTTSNDGSSYGGATTLVDNQTPTTIGIVSSNYNATPANDPAATTVVDYFYNSATPGTGATPYVSNASISTTQTTASASFTTDLNTTTTFQYGTTTSYGTSVTDSGSGTQSHSFALSGLTSGTTYHYKYTATYGAQTYTSSDATFTAQTQISQNTATYTTADGGYPSDSGVFNVKSSPYNAVGNGVADDTAAIQAAMDAARRSGNNIVYLPAGTYLISRTLYGAFIPTTNVAGLTAHVSGGCITGVTVNSGQNGSGYQTPFATGGVILSGGGGSGANQIHTNVSSGSITSVAISNNSSVTCVGHGYTSAPTVTAVGWYNYLHIEGHNSSDTFIRLKDNTFTNHSCNIGSDDSPNQEQCKAMLWYGNWGGSNINGAGEDGYTNDLWNVTLDTGNGNAGAVGVVWEDSNQAEIKNVVIKSEDGSGRAGLNMSVFDDTGGGWGPGLVKNMQVLGFDYGIYDSYNTGEVGTTYEYIDLENQNTAGVFHTNLNAWFRHVSSVNTVPAFIVGYKSSMALVDGNFTGGSSSVSAIQNQSTDSGGLAFFRNIQTSGYASALSTGTANTKVNGSNISEYTYPAPVAQFGGSIMTSLNLSVPQTPEYIDTNFSADWANVASYGSACNGSGNADSTACVQSAFNSGKSVVYFPAGHYFFTGTVTIPASLRVIHGMGSYLMFATGSGGYPNDDGAHRATYNVFQINATSANPIEIRDFAFDLENQPGTTIYNASNRPVVMTNAYNVSAYANQSGTNGTVYMEDVAIVGQSDFEGTTAYLHQYDNERCYLHLNVNGGTVYIFGYKTEGSCDSLGQDWLFDVNNATFELIGQFSQANQGNTGHTAMKMTNSNFTLSDSTVANGGTPLLQEVRSGTTNNYSYNSGWNGYNAFSLYSGRTQ